MSKLHEIFCAHYAWPCLRPPLTTMKYANISSFVDDDIFTH